MHSFLRFSPVPFVRALSLLSVENPPFTMLPNFPVDWSHISGFVVHFHKDFPSFVPKSSYHWITEWRNSRKKISVDSVGYREQETYFHPKAFEKCRAVFQLFSTTQLFPIALVDNSDFRMSLVTAHDGFRIAIWFYSILRIEITLYDFNAECRQWHIDNW